MDSVGPSMVYPLRDDIHQKALAGLVSTQVSCPFFSYIIVHVHNSFYPHLATRTLWETTMKVLLRLSDICCILHIYKDNNCIIEDSQVAQNNSQQYYP